ncbi:hypothetical protein [Clostridium sp. LP20]|uniref:hypothetical protein n=1 Tax=Clostridium sp. LP20 TaxID=3418665 RepID=UPI003EE76F48
MKKPTLREQIAELQKENHDLKIKMDKKGLTINDKYKVESEESNVIIYEKRIPKVNEGEEPKEPKWLPISYHPNLEMAYRSLMTKEINGTGLKDIETVLDKISELKSFIKEVTR